jgi:hypothetical protein
MVAALSGPCRLVFDLACHAQTSECSDHHGKRRPRLQLTFGDKVTHSAAPEVLTLPYALGLAPFLFSALPILQARNALRMAVAHVYPLVLGTPAVAAALAWVLARFA